MSDCANGGRSVYERPEGYPVLKLMVEFDKGEPWMYSIALNWREAKAIHASLFPFEEEWVMRLDG